MEACTVTALGVIAAFADSNPDCPSQSRRFFRVRLPSGSPLQADHPAYFGLAKLLFEPTLSAVDVSEGKRHDKKCQRRFSVQTENPPLWKVEIVFACKGLAYGSAGFIDPRFAQLLQQISFRAADAPNKQLDAKSHLKHGDLSGNRMSDLVAYVDGGSLGNPGPSGIGVVIEGCAGGPIRIAKWIGSQDNNVAEYVALLEAMQFALALKAEVLHVYSDSEVVVRQMQGHYACRSPRLYSLHWICRKLARSFKFSITHVPRERNAEANRLANSAVRTRLASLTGKRASCTV